MGDARLKLKEHTDRKYALLLVDAFSSDAIPVHLLTSEAVQLYMDRITDDGILALHISNKYVRLEPVVGAIAADLGLTARLWSDSAERGRPGQDGVELGGGGQGPRRHSARSGCRAEEQQARYGTTFRTAVEAQGDAGVDRRLLGRDAGDDDQGDHHACGGSSACRRSRMTPSNKSRALVGVVGASARAAVHSLARAGFAAWAVDLFADRDLDARRGHCAVCPSIATPTTIPDSRLASRPARCSTPAGWRITRAVIAELAATPRTVGQPAGSA